ncbi:MAG: 4'-phosphopantetheinyl transferase family protein [Myxococcota bacterium]
MVGNDIVDLRDPDVVKGPAHARFDARVFTRSERRALGQSGAPERLRWFFWGAKEAAYKLAKKQDPEVVFSPSRFVVTLDASLVGEVAHGDRRIPVKLAAGSESVHAIASESEAAERIIAGVATTTSPLDPSLAVRELAAAALAERLALPRSAVRIGRRGRIPTLELLGRDTPLDLSLSHHGRFVAFACDLGGAA